MHLLDQMMPACTFLYSQSAFKAVDSIFLKESLGLTSATTISPKLYKKKEIMSSVCIHNK
jgi:hypothetical protein